jgi:hypothetical protein
MKQPTVLPVFGFRWLLFLCVAVAFFSGVIQKISTPFLRHFGVGLQEIYELIMLLVVRKTTPYQALWAFMEK